MPRKIESFFIPGPAGRLECILEVPDDGPVLDAALVCHPHPLHGGTMHNKVVYRLARGLRRSGCAVLRFNFRGVNLSGGVYDHGVGELEDARAALGELRMRHPDVPYTLAGFSFGSRTAAALAAELGADGPWRWIGAGFPTTLGEFAPIERFTRLRIFLHSMHDEFGPQTALQAFYDRLWGPKQLLWVEARDHFFAGGLDELEAAVGGLGKLSG